VSLRLPHRAVSSALPYSLNRAAADGQLVTLSAGILVEIMPGYDVIVVKLLLLIWRDWRKMAMVNSFAQLLASCRPSSAS